MCLPEAVFIWRMLPKNRKSVQGLVHVTESVDYLLEMKTYFENSSIPSP
jgi:hypothetical protein